MSHIAAALNPRSVLIATDFSEVSEKAMRHSLALARFYGSEFCLAHVVSSLSLTLAGPDSIAACEEAVLREAADLEASLIRTGALTGIQYKFIVRQGELWPELREIIREESADLLVVGTHGRHGISKLLFGSTAEQLFRQADCAVLTFGPHTDDRPWFDTSSHVTCPRFRSCENTAALASSRLIRRSRIGFRPFRFSQRPPNVRDRSTLVDLSRRERSQQLGKAFIYCPNSVSALGMSREACLGYSDLVDL